MDASVEFVEVLNNLKNLSEFDARIFSELKDDTDALVALKIMARFSITLNEGASGISEGLTTLNHETIWKALHKTAGSAELVGFRQFGHRSRELLTKVRTGGGRLDSDELEEYLERSKKLLADIHASFKNLKGYL